MTQSGPLRSILFVPATKPELAKKAAASQADRVCIDLEDAVCLSHKPKARLNIEAMAQVLRGAKPFWLRVNPELEELTLDLAASPDDCEALVLSKTRDFTHLELLDDAMCRRFGGGGPRLIAMLESPASISSFAHQTPAGKIARLMGLALGSEDLANELGVSAEADIISLLFYQLVLAANSLGVAALGLPGTIANYRETKAFATAARKAAEAGASGSFCIHPSQITPLNEAFTPTPDDLNRARAIIKAFEGSDGVASTGGQMIDRPIYLRAKALLERG